VYHNLVKFWERTACVYIIHFRQWCPQLDFIDCVGCIATITILASRLAAGIVNFDSVDDVVISAAVSGAPVTSTRAALRVVRGPGVYGIVNVPFQVTLQGSHSGAAAMHVTPSSGVVTFLDRQVSSKLYCQLFSIHKEWSLIWKIRKKMLKVIKLDITRDKS